jgi:hypothetical protein
MLSTMAGNSRHLRLTLFFVTGTDWLFHERGKNEVSQTLYQFINNEKDFINVKLLRKRNYHPRQ